MPKFKKTHSDSVILRERDRERRREYSQWDFAALLASRPCKIFRENKTSKQKRETEIERAERQREKRDR